MKWSLGYEPFMRNRSGRSLLRSYTSTHFFNHLLTSSRDQHSGWTGVWWYSITVTSPGYSRYAHTSPIIINPSRKVTRNLVDSHNLSNISITKLNSPLNLCSKNCNIEKLCNCMTQLEVSSSRIELWNDRLNSNWSRYICHDYATNFVDTVTVAHSNMRWTLFAHVLKISCELIILAGLLAPLLLISK